MEQSSIREEERVPTGQDLPQKQREIDSMRPRRGIDDMLPKSTSLPFDLEALLDLKRSAQSSKPTLFPPSPKNPMRWVKQNSSLLKLLQRTKQQTKPLESKDSELMKSAAVETENLCLNLSPEISALPDRNPTGGLHKERKGKVYSTLLDRQKKLLFPEKQVAMPKKLTADNLGKGKMRQTNNLGRLFKPKKIKKKPVVEEAGKAMPSKEGVTNELSTNKMPVKKDSSAKRGRGRPHKEGTLRSRGGPRKDPLSDYKEQGAVRKRTPPPLSKKEAENADSTKSHGPKGKVTNRCKVRMAFSDLLRDKEGKETQAKEVATLLERELRMAYKNKPEKDYMNKAIDLRTTLIRNTALRKKVYDGEISLSDLVKIPLTKLAEEKKLGFYAELKKADAESHRLLETLPPVLAVVTEREYEPYF